MKQSEIEATILLRNHTPLDDFNGLTPNEMHHLMYDTFGERSPIQFRPAIADNVLDKIPFFRLVEAFIRIVERDKKMKLTPGGALQRKVLHELYGHRFITDWYIDSDYIKAWNENHWMPMFCARMTAVIAGLVRISKGKVLITSKGTKLLKAGKRTDLFKIVFEAFSREFNWAYNDLYTEFPVGQLGFGYSMYLIDRFGSKRLPATFYSSAYLRAFPGLIEHFIDNTYFTAEKQFHNCYILRVFERFMEWFGLVQIKSEKEQRYNQDAELTRSALFGQLFEIE